MWLGDNWNCVCGTGIPVGLTTYKLQQCLNDVEQPFEVSVWEITWQLVILFEKIGPNTIFLQK